MAEERPIVLNVAGFDPCGGAGVLADVKTCEQHVVQGMAVITANTIQTGKRFLHLDWTSMNIIINSIEILMQSYPISVVKIGIVKDAAFLSTITHSIRQYNADAFIIWDPVLKSSSGFHFFDTADAISLVPVLKQIDLITPNFDEFRIFQPFFENDYSNALLIKGGHQPENKGVDILQQGNKEIHLYPNIKKVYAKHGSGCVLSAAIAANIALGKDLETACRQAKLYIEDYLNSHPSLLGYHAH